MKIKKRKGNNNWKPVKELEKLDHKQFLNFLTLVKFSQFQLSTQIVCKTVIILRLLSHMLAIFPPFPLLNN